MVLGRPAALVRVVDEKLLRPSVDGILGGLRRLGLVRVRAVRRHARQQVALELSPGPLQRPAAQPVVELARVFEGEELEDEALALQGEEGGLGESSRARAGHGSRRRRGRSGGGLDAHCVRSRDGPVRRGSLWEGIDGLELAIAKRGLAAETEAHVIGVCHNMVQDEDINTDWSVVCLDDDDASKY